MQKINVLGIIWNHLSTLRNEAGRFMLSDLAVFVALPLACGTTVFAAGWSISKDALGQSIAVFAIFAALLLSVQVALYSVSLRPMKEPEDSKRTRIYEERKRSRSGLLKELNDNISYLILSSVLFVTLLLVSYMVDWRSPIASALICGLYLHFFLTLLMVIKRASIVFSREYETH